MGKRLRKLVFTTHVTSSLGWTGAVVVFLVLALIGMTSPHEATVRGAYLVMAPTAWLVLVPLAHASLLTGAAISLGTPWGLFRHYWVFAKLAITVAATILLLVYLGTFGQMAATAGNPMQNLSSVRNPSPVVHSVLALLALITATVLAIYKPFGLTPFGQDYRDLRRQDYAVGVVILLVVLFVVLHLFLGGAAHGH